MDVEGVGVVANGDGAPSVSCPRRGLIARLRELGTVFKAADGY